MTCGTWVNIATLDVGSTTLGASVLYSSPGKRYRLLSACCAADFIEFPEKSMEWGFTEAAYNTWLDSLPQYDL